MRRERAKSVAEGKVKRRRFRFLRCLIGLLILAGFFWYGLPWCFPIPDDLKIGRKASPVLLDRHGEVMKYFAAEDFTRARPSLLEKIPSRLIDCTLAAEDKRFYEHGGIDLIATSRSLLDILRKRRVVSGASTITQQLAKLSRPKSERDLKAKFFEAMLARRLEMTWDKQRILEEYFNRLDYGNLRISPAEAARFYFQKPLSDLSLSESALLAGLPQAPSRLNPLKNTANAIARRDTVLDRLMAIGKYGVEEMDMAREEKLRLRPLNERVAAPWLNRLPSGVGEIRTTLDMRLQEDIEAIVKQETAKLQEANLRHAAVVVIDNTTGDLLAVVSSADWNDERGGQIHGALSPRSPGSALKPFTYLLSFGELDKLPSSVIADIPTKMLTQQGMQLPENYDRRYRGPVTIRTALACSLNIPALRELEELGGPQKLHYLLGELGISTLGEDQSEYGLGLTLGNAPVKLLELTNAYAALARGGSYLPTRLFMDESTTNKVDIFNERDAWLITDVLSDREARAPLFSMGGPLDLPFRCAVKTGTSSDFRDNWCIGYTPQFTVGVWAGNFENQPMKNVSGVTGAGPIFHRTLVRAHRDLAATWYDVPEGMSRINVDRRTGKRLSDDMMKEYAVNDWAPKGKEVPLAVLENYDGEGRALLGPIFRDWYVSGQNGRKNELALDEKMENVIPLQIFRPRNNTTILLDPEIPGDSSQLSLQVNLPEFVEWNCDSLQIERGVAKLVVGRHVLVAKDIRDGTRHEVVIDVKDL